MKNHKFFSNYLIECFESNKPLIIHTTNDTSSTDFLIVQEVSNNKLIGCNAVNIVSVITALINPIQLDKEIKQQLINTFLEYTLRELDDSKPIIVSLETIANYVFARMSEVGNILLDHIKDIKYNIYFLISRNEIELSSIKGNYIVFETFF